MKDFVKFVTTILLVAIISFSVCFIFTCSALWINISTYGNEDVRVPEDCHTIIVGNSMTAYTFNDTILSPWKNMGKTAQYYIDIAPALELTLKNNIQIDTVLIGVGIPSFDFNIPDSIYTHRNITTYQEVGKSTLLDFKVLIFNLIHNPKYKYFLLTNGVENLIEKPKINGEYLPLTSHAIMYGCAGIKNYERELRKRGKLSYTKEEIEKENYIQIQGLKDVIRVCRLYDVECILINTPLYNINQYVSDDGYKELLKTMGDSLLIADYSSFEIPDTCYFRDVIHLNYGGSVYFSSYLKKEGLQTQYLVDYVNGSK